MRPQLRYAAASKAGFSLSAFSFVGLIRRSISSTRNTGRKWDSAMLPANQVFHAAIVEVPQQRLTAPPTLWQLHFLTLLSPMSPLIPIYTPVRKQTAPSLRPRGDNMGQGTKSCFVRFQAGRVQTYRRSAPTRFRALLQPAAVSAAPRRRWSRHRYPRSPSHVR